VDERAVAEAVLAGPDAIIAADREGVIGFWNAGAERIFGYPRDEAVGQSLDLIIPERFRERHWAGWRRVVEAGQSRYGAGDLLSVPSQQRDGSKLSIEFTIHPVHDPAGGLQGIAATVRDATPHFEEIRALRRKLAERQDPPAGGAADGTPSHAGDT
jgi:PAS domain S-box-containing protein